MKGETPNRFLLRLGLSRSYFYEVLNGKKAPSIGLLSSIANTAGLSLEWMATGVGMRAAPSGTIAEIPCYVVCSDASLVMTDETMIVPVSWLVDTEPGNAAIVRAPDGTLKPTVSQDDELVVELGVSWLVDGFTYLFEVDGAPTIRRIKCVGRDAVLLISEECGRSFASADLFTEERYEILARVIKIIKDAS